MSAVPTPQPQLKLLGRFVQAVLFSVELQN
jgi:hypothetical protein